MKGSALFFMTGNIFDSKIYDIYMNFDNINSNGFKY